MTVISTYAPTLDSEEEIKDTFYASLDEVIRNISTLDKIALLGDFNARVGKNSSIWSGVIGKHGTGNMNANGLRLLSICAEHQLCFTNTMFQLLDKLKTTWMHPSSKKWHLLDYVIVRHRDIRDVQITRAMRSAECCTDHRLLRSIFQTVIRPSARKQPPKPRLNVALLKNIETRKVMQDNLHERLSGLSANTNSATDLDIEALWSSLSEALQNASKEVLGYTRRKNPDWFDENVDEILPLLNAAFQDRLAHPASTVLEKWKRTTSTQRRLREIQNEWWINKAREIQRYADDNRFYELFKTIKGIYGPFRRTSIAVRSADGNTLLKDKQQNLERWAEHFQELLNRVNPSDPTALDELPTLPLVPELDECPTLNEVKDAVQALKNKKTAGEDAIPGEVYKYGGIHLLLKLTDFLSACWCQGIIPSSWKHATIVTIYKK
ncbi:craniofacial development protein 2-like [Anneissia japonica]|uniref:craniofacial development protein 2-like n=1 Tax=Anneissia japonica TaxID=1529436 RepID=UPI0014257A11|nr:craniofacial development protein 2-like [Anneissia japonica]